MDSHQLAAWIFIALGVALIAFPRLFRSWNDALSEINAFRVGEQLQAIPLLVFRALGTVSATAAVAVLVCAA